jgi:hypothetical protein
MDEYDKEIDKWLDETAEVKSDDLLKSCGIPVDKIGALADKIVEDIPPELTERILKEYIERDRMWLRIGEVTKTLLDGYKPALLALSVAGRLDALTASTLIESCDGVIGAIKAMRGEG